MFVYDKYMTMTDVQYQSQELMGGGSQPLPTSPYPFQDCFSSDNISSLPSLESSKSWLSRVPNSKSRVLNPFCGKMGK